MPICALCEEIVPKLEESHLIPRAAYKHLLSKTSNNFVKMDVTQKVAHYDVKQISCPLLCKGCEDLFSKNCETQMGMLWATASEFPLLTEINACTSLADRCYDAISLQEFSRNALIYFAVSIIWRAYVWSGNKYRTPLGEKYAKEFQNFLYHGSKLSKFKLILEVNSNPDHATNNFCTFPSFVKNEDGSIHTFIILGITFNILVDQTSSMVERAFEKLQSDCLIIVDDNTNSKKHLDISNSAQNLVTLKGKLSKYNR